MIAPSQSLQHERSSRCIFTICTKSYIGLADSLGLSMRDNGVTDDFMIIVVDHDLDDVNAKSGQIVSAQEFCKYPDEDWTSRTFKYDLVELCTSIKARAFQCALELGYEKVIYFDPDIIVFDDLAGLFDPLDSYDIVTTPHRMSVQSAMPARGGVFNLGFLAARRGAPTDKVMKWWDERLEHYSINDPLRGYFTDQKWMDHLPVLLRNDRLLISDHPGMNLAPFNAVERELREKNGKWEARLKDDGTSWQPLCFVHFSALEYRSLAAGTGSEAAKHVAAKLPGFDALLTILESYLKRGGFLDYAATPYEYGFFSGGAPVLPGHRRIYHRLLDAERVIPAPFQDEGALYKSLKRARLLAPIGSAQASRPDTQTRTTQIGRTAKVLDFVTRIAVFLLGYRRYSLLSKFLIRYFHQVNHARLLRDLGRDIDVEYF